MNELAVVEKGTDWRRLKALVLDSVSSPITKRVYNLGLDEFFTWYSQGPKPGFTNCDCGRLARCAGSPGLGVVSINVRTRQSESCRGRRQHPLARTGSGEMAHLVCQKS